MSRELYLCGSEMPAPSGFIYWAAGQGVFWHLTACYLLHLVNPAGKVLNFQFNNVNASLPSRLIFLLVTCE